MYLNAAQLVAEKQRGAEKAPLNLPEGETLGRSFNNRYTKNN